MTASWTGGVALGVLCLALASCSESAPAPQAASSAADLARDARIEYLLAPCAKNEHYDVDTSDVEAILLENLLHGQRDPLRRAKEELGAMGEAGIAIARRVVAAHFDSPDGGPHLRNAIEVATRSDAPGARELLAEMLGHPEQGIVIQAVVGLEKHGSPAEFDLVRALFERIDPEFKAKLAYALHDLDAERADEQYLDWIAAAEWTGLWEGFQQRIARSESPRIAERCRALWPALEPRYQPGLAAPCARAGDAEALAKLRELLRGDNVYLRRLSLECLADAGLERELAATLREDRDPQMRALAAGILAAPERVASYVAELRSALADRDPQVALTALNGLAAHGDAAALERALALLGEPSSDSTGAAMNVLQQPMRADPALAGRVFARLEALRGADAHRPLEEQVPILQALGRVPLEQAARTLHELSRDAQGQLAGMRASRWLTIQAGNGGETGQRVLSEAFERERDPLRRIDLLEGVTTQGGDYARDCMLAVLESDSTAPYETLYAADRLTRLARVGVAAPAIKRAALRTTQADVRLALQCLLWSHYPGPR